MDENPYAPPQADLTTANPLGELEYVGFWARVGASIIDTILMVLITLPLAFAVYGGAYFESEALVQGFADVLISYVLPFVAVLLFWRYKSATPGKMAINSIIVDAKTGGKPSTGQLVGRYFAYFLSTIVLMLGFIWVAFDKRKQGWHDKLAGTLVVRKP